MSVDLAFLDGQVLTVDSQFTVAQAVAVEDGRIVAVGDNADIRELIGRDTHVIELAGRTLLPGINDSHLHGCALGASLPPLEIDVGYPAVRSIADVKRAVAEQVAAHAPGEPIVGNGWDAGYLAECKADSRRHPTRWDLDEVAPENPVYLQDFSRHVAWVNTAWLRHAGLTGDEDPPSGGVIPRDGDRGVIGLYVEGAQDLVQAALPELDDARKRACIDAALAWLHREGITSYTEPGLGPGGDVLMGGAMSTGVLDAYTDMVRRGELPARLTVLWLPCSMTGSASEVRRNLGDVRFPADLDAHNIRLVGAKIFADGIPPNKTSWMYDEYVGGGHGSLCVHGHTEHERAIELTEMIRLVHDAGLQAGVHVTGDAAIDAVVSAFTNAAEKRPWPARHYVIHGDFVRPHSLRALASAGFGLNMNPAIKWTIADQMTELLGPERSAWQWPVASALAAGVPVSSSSDAPVVKPDWRRGVSAMMLRESKATGQVTGPDQVVGLEAALRAYTSTPAWQDFAEDWKGTIEVGKVADLCVVGGDLRRTDPHDIPDLPVDLTVFDGRIVYDRLAG